MKKIVTFLLVIFLVCQVSMSALATESTEETTKETIDETTEETIEETTAVAPAKEETTHDMSTPRLMVTAYSLDTKELTPGKTSTLKITFHNYSETKSLRNVKLSIFDESGQIEIDGMGTEYLRRIYVGADYVWEVKLKALPTAEIGKHKLRVTGEYEDLYFSSYSSSDTLDITVKQSVSLDHSGLTMPDKIVEGDTNTMVVTVMNTGKTDIRNCKLTFASETLESSGTTFVGEIAAGESATANLNYKQPMGKLGKAAATVEISYEDAFGNKKSEKVKLSTVAEEKVEVAQKQEEEEKSKYNLWWLFVLLGAAVGGGLGFGIPTAIRNKKQRKEDELRL